MTLPKTATDAELRLFAGLVLILLSLLMLACRPPALRHARLIADADMSIGTRYGKSASTIAGRVPARRGISPIPLQRARSFRRPPLRARISLLLAARRVLFSSLKDYGCRPKPDLRRFCWNAPSCETVETGDNVKPWSWADTWPIARIEVKRLNANAIVLHGSSGQALAFGPGHIETTPHAGGAGTVVYSAHRDTHFRFLKDVVVGDDIDVTRRDGTLYRYRVTHFSVVHWDNPGSIRSPTGTISSSSPAGRWRTNFPGRCAISCMRSWWRRSLRENIAVPARAATSR